MPTRFEGAKTCAAINEGAPKLANGDAVAACADLPGLYNVSHTVGFMMAKTVMMAVMMEVRGRLYQPRGGVRAGDWEAVRTTLLQPTGVNTYAHVGAFYTAGSKWWCENCTDAARTLFGFRAKMASGIGLGE